MQLKTCPFGLRYPYIMWPKWNWSSWEMQRHPLAPVHLLFLFLSRGCLADLLWHGPYRRYYRECQRETGKGAFGPSNLFSTILFSDTTSSHPPRPQGPVYWAVPPIRAHVRYFQLRGEEVLLSKETNLSKWMLVPSRMCRQKIQSKCRLVPNHI